MGTLLVIGGVWLLFMVLHGALTPTKHTLLDMDKLDKGNEDVTMGRISKQEYTRRLKRGDYDR